MPLTEVFRQLEYSSPYEPTGGIIPDKEKYLNGVRFLEQNIFVGRQDLPIAVIAAKQLGDKFGSMFAHTKDPVLVLGKDGKPAKGSDGLYHLHFTGDTIRDGEGGGRAWGLAVAEKPEGPWSIYYGNKDDNHGVPIDTQFSPYRLFKPGIIKDRNRLVAFIPTKGEMKEPSQGLINRSEPKTYFECALSQNKEGTEFKSVGIALESEPGETIYDVSPFIDELGQKSLVYVSQRMPYSEIKIVKSVDNTWTGPWTAPKTIVTHADVLTQHDNAIHGDDMEFTLESPHISIVKFRHNKAAILTLTGFYPPPVERSYRQHSLVMAAEHTNGKFHYIADATRHTDGGLDNFRSGEAGALFIVQRGGNLIGYQQSKAVQPFDKPYPHQPWVIEVLHMKTTEFLKYVHSVLPKTN